MVNLTVRKENGIQKVIRKVEQSNSRLLKNTYYTCVTLFVLIILAPIMKIFWPIELLPQGINFTRIGLVVLITLVVSFLYLTKTDGITLVSILVSTLLFAWITCGLYCLFIIVMRCAPSEEKTLKTLILSYSREPKYELVKKSGRNKSDYYYAAWEYDKIRTGDDFYFQFKVNDYITSTKESDFYNIIESVKDKKATLKIIYKEPIKNFRIVLNKEYYTTK